MAAIDLDAMWDFDEPAESETRFRAALAQVNGDDALVLRTQIARTYSLRGMIRRRAPRARHRRAAAAEARGAEPRVRALLERGRTLRSAQQPVQARPLFVRAFESADKAKLEALAADALHMVALVEPTVEGQLEWNRKAVALRARRRPIAKARSWEGAALNNIGVTLNEAGRHAEALAVFRDALAAYERAGKAGTDPRCAAG